MDTNFVPTVPQSLSNRLIWRDGSFHASEELQANMELDALFARYMDEMGGVAVPCVWYEPRTFDNRFGIRFDGKEDGENQTVRYIVDLLKKAKEQKVSDIHITYAGPYTTIEFRQMGQLQPYQPLTGTEGFELISALFQSRISQTQSTFSTYERHDGRIADRKYLPEGVFAVRLHSEPIQTPLSAEPGVFVAIRLLFDATGARGTLEERTASLGFTPAQQRLLKSFTERSGLTIIAGATGHGKSTLLKNVMEAMAEHQPTKNYMTQEDPPEYVIRGAKQVCVVTSSSEKARKEELVDSIAGLVRSDPDVIMIGEIRYREMAEAAINAALTGHGVWTTLHASSAFGILIRLREMGVPLEDMCADGVLTGLVYQRLLPILCPHCRKPLLAHQEAISDRLWDRLGRIYREDELKGIYVREKSGCPECRGVGLVGLQVAAEIVPINRTILDFLKEKRMREAQEYWLKRLDGMTHIEYARRRVAAGEVDPSLAEERLGVTLDHDHDSPEEAA